MIQQVNKQVRTIAICLLIVSGCQLVPCARAQDSIFLEAKLPTGFKEHLFVPSEDGVGLAMIAPEAPIDLAITGNLSQSESSARPKNSGYSTEVWKLADAGMLLTKGSSPELNMLAKLNGEQITRVVGRVSLANRVLSFSNDLNRVKIHSENEIHGDFVEWTITPLDSEMSAIGIVLNGHPRFFKICFGVSRELAVPSEVFWQSEFAGDVNQVDNQFRSDGKTERLAHSLRVKSINLNGWELKDVDVSESKEFEIGFGLLQRFNFDFSFLNNDPKLRIAMTKTTNTPPPRLRSGEILSMMCADGLLIVGVPSWSRFFGILKDNDIVTESNDVHLDGQLRDSAKAHLLFAWEAGTDISISRGGKTSKFRRK